MSHSTKFFSSGGQGDLFKKTAREASGPPQKLFIKGYLANSLTKLKISISSRYESKVSSGVW